MKTCSESKDSGLGHEGQGGDLAEPEGGRHDLVSAKGDAIVERLGGPSDESVGAEESQQAGSTAGRAGTLFIWAALAFTIAVNTCPARHRNRCPRASSVWASR
jgi:hypothetical protein